MSITRGNFRRSVAHMLDDYALATDAAGGFTNQFTDRTTLARETGYFQGMQIYFCNPASPNYGHIATVNQSDWATRTIFFEPPLAENSVAGEQIEMYNFRGVGTTKNQYDHHINDAVMIARENHALVPRIEAGTGAFNSRAPQLDIPASFTSFSYLRYYLSDGNYMNLAPRYLRVDRLSRTVEVRGLGGQAMHGKTYAFVGYGEQDLPTDDDDLIHIDAEWMFNEVKAQVLERKIAAGRPVGSQDRLYLQERTESGGKRGLIVARAVPNTVRL